MKTSASLGRMVAAGVWLNAETLFNSGSVQFQQIDSVRGSQGFPERITASAPGSISVVAAVVMPSVERVEGWLSCCCSNPLLAGAAVGPETTDNREILPKLSLRENGLALVCLKSLVEAAPSVDGAANR
jgi:hypothetical protein